MICYIGSEISLSETAQNHRYSEKDLEVGMNEGCLVKETGPSAALRREMKKIEALLEGHPCLEDNRYTVADIFGGSSLAFGPAAGGPIAHSLVLGCGPLGGAGLGTGRAIGLAIERAGPCFARRVAGSAAVDNLSLRDNPFGGNIVGRILLVLDRTAVDSRLSLLPVPSQDSPNHYERFVTTPVEGGCAKAPERVGPGECWRISFGAFFISQ